jgi:hypothetical protein
MIRRFSSRPNDRSHRCSTHRVPPCRLRAPPSGPNMHQRHVGSVSSILPSCAVPLTVKKTTGRLIKHARYYLPLTEKHRTCRRIRNILDAGQNAKMEILT